MTKCNLDKKRQKTLSLCVLYELVVEKIKKISPRAHREHRESILRNSLNEPLKLLALISYP